jgi:hypothetical protein
MEQNKMETDLILLLISTSVKSLALAVIGYFLYNKWKKQNQTYKTDFPFLMAILFLIFSLAKIFDLYLYIRFNDTPNLAELNTPDALNIAKFRFLFSPVLCLAPMVLLMLIIWFGDKRRLQISIGTAWATISIGAVLFAQNYPQLLSLISIVAFPPIVLSIITFGIINYQKKLPEINSKFLAIGWFGYIITQLIRPIWITLGSGVFGLSWLGELVELVILVVIGLGYMRPSSYSSNKKKPVGENIKKQNQSSLKTLSENKKLTSSVISTVD